MIERLTKLVSTVRALVTEPLPPVPPLHEAPQKPASDAPELVGLWGETPLQCAERRAREYFAVIQLLETQRNTWRAKFYKVVRGHAPAQAMLEAEIARQRVVVANMLRAQNAMRAELGKEPLDLPAFLEPSAPPVGIATAYFKDMRALLAELPSLFPLPAETHEHLTVTLTAEGGVFTATYRIPASDEKLSGIGATEWEALHNLARMVASHRGMFVDIIRDVTIDVVHALLVVEPRGD